MKLVMKTLWQLLVKKKNYQQIKESIRMMKSQRSDTEKINLVEEGKSIGIHRILNVMKLLIAI